MTKRRKSDEIIKARYVAIVEITTLAIVGISTAILAYAERLSPDAVGAIFGIMLLYAFGRVNGTWKKSPIQTLAEMPDKVRLWRLIRDPVLFARTVLGFEPYEYQAEFLDAVKTVKRGVLCWGRQTGKTTVVATAAIWFAFTHPRIGISPTTVLIVSKALRQSIIMFRTINNMIHGNPLLARSITHETRTTIELSNGAMIVVLPCGHDGSPMRGYTAHLLIIDEAAFVKESIITEVCMPMLSTTNGTLLMLSTPYGKRHIFYTSFMNPKFWQRKYASSICPRITKEFLEEQKIELGNTKFKQEYGAEFVDDSSSWLPQDLIRDVTEDYHLVPEQAVVAGLVETGHKYMHHVGVDFAKKQDHSVIYVWRVEKWADGQEKLRTIHIKEFPICDPEESKVHYKQVLSYLKLVVAAFEVASLVYDQTGVGEALGEDVVEIYKPAKGVVLSDAKKKDVMTFFRLRMEQKRFLVPFDKRLMDQMNCEEYHISGDKLLFSHPSGTHDDQLWAGALGIFGTFVGEEPKKTAGVIINA